MKRVNYVLIAFISYLASFLVYLILPASLKEIHWDPGDLHIHHFFYGILINNILFLVAVYSQRVRTKVYLSIFYGFATFLLVDETQMWLWLDQSIDNEHPLRQLPGVITMLTFLSALLIQKLRKNKSP